MRGVSGELVILLISFVVWILGTIAERKRRETERHPRTMPDEGGAPRAERDPRRTSAEARTAAEPTEPVPEILVSDWKPAGIRGPAWTPTVGVTLSGAQRRQHHARDRLRLGEARKPDRRRALQRAILLAEVLGPPLALRQHPPGQDAPAGR